jgi:hypothetical protein
MRFDLKSFKTLQVFPNGCIYFDSSIYLRTFKKYNFFRKNLVINISKSSPTVMKHSNLFYLKYRDQIFKNLINEFTINCKKH